MSDNQLTLKPINDLLSESFFIPAYQRGYRWTARQVTELLDDIRDFQQQSENSKKETFYCLQPVVVKKHAQGWEVVDGQQRLTTIFIILTYLKDIAALLEKQRYRIFYETRPNCDQFLQDIDVSRSNENIDFYHICAAKKAVEEWFGNHDGIYKLKFLQTLLSPDDTGKNVKVIWYDIQEDIDPIDVFTRLNIGKIPLTNAELVKALFLRSGNFGKNDADGQISLRQVQISQAWDDIERALQHDDFWYFLNNTDTYTNRIELVLKLIADQLTFPNAKSAVSDPYYVFIAFFNWFKNGATFSTLGEIETTEGKWEIVQQHFLQLEEWFEHRVWFHLIGFLINQDTPVGKLFSKNNQLHGKHAFLLDLREAAAQELFPKKASTDQVVPMLHNIASWEYRDKQSQIQAALLLFNIASILRNRATNMRFQFDRYKKDNWDLEHIRSVKSNKPERPDDQKRWLQSVLEYATGVTAPKNANEYQQWLQDVRTKLNEKMARQAATEQKSTTPDLSSLCVSAVNLLAVNPFISTQFDEIYVQVLACFEENIEVETNNSIANLALLDSHTNRSYGNAVFSIKRKRIIDLDKKGTFVPICTKNVFLKYYSHEADKLMFWSKKDADDYQHAIIDMLTWFFSNDNLEQLL